MAESSDIKNQKQSGVKNMNNMCKWLFNVSRYVYRNIHTSPEMHEIGKWLVEDTLTYVQYVLILNIYAPQICFIFSLSRIDNNKIYPKISEYMQIICIAEKMWYKKLFWKREIRHFLLAALLATYCSIHKILRHFEHYEWETDIWLPDSYIWKVKYSGC